MAEAVYRYPDGELHVAAPEALVSGEVIVFGERIGIYTGLNPAASGDDVNFSTKGIYDIDATDADTWADGDILYWDPATSKVTDVAGALKKAGLAVGSKGVTTSAKALVDINARQ